MIISDILRGKGSDVVTVPPDTSIEALVGLLAEHGIGAVVVSSDGATVEGIISERDVVRALAAQGPGVLSATVDEICTRDVITTTPSARARELRQVMTDGRFRHVPVISDGRLQGIVSIGDVVKASITQLESDAAALTNYITSG
ncbi:MAG: CBS domain-containing protein [Actinomycetia bacterium]|nr:CBS domain-containing protein [Actinomycetes bacterium]